MFYIEHRMTGEKRVAVITPVDKADLKQIGKRRYWFNWSKEKGYELYKIHFSGCIDILGLLSIQAFPSESRIQIRLLSVSRENVGNNGEYKHIAGNLITFACMESLKRFRATACVSLIPKTKLIGHYIEKYGFKDAKTNLYLEGEAMLKLVKQYNHEENHE